jgi:pimeloyl-ACP methyl ester carboxylesterase
LRRWTEPVTLWQITPAAERKRHLGGRQVLADRSGHFVQEEQPDLVVDAIRTFF